MSRGTLDLGNVKGPQGDQGATGPQGPQGVPGPAGPRGYGIPSGGTDGQVMIKDGSIDYKAKWGSVPGLSGKKGVQTPVSDPAAQQATSIHFISGISQNAQGVISPVKKQVRVMQGSTATVAGNIGLVPTPSAGQSDRYLRCDGSWAVPPNDNTEYNVFAGATSSAAGTAGLVPAPTSGTTDRYLDADGTWKQYLATDFFKISTCTIILDSNLYAGASYTYNMYGYSSTLSSLIPTGYKPVAIYGYNSTDPNIILTEWDLRFLTNSGALGITIKNISSSPSGSGANIYIDCLCVKTAYLDTSEVDPWT